MRRLIPTLLCCLCVVTVLIAAQSPTSDRVGVVDLNRVFEEYSKKDQLEGELAAVKAAMEAKFKEIDEQLSKLHDERELTEKGTSRYGEIEDSAAALVQKRKRLQRESAADFQRRKLAFHDQLLKQIDQTISSFATEHGYTAILQREFTLSSEAMSWKSVLFAAPTADVTDQILQRLNTAGQ